jgi:hypothetical protein
MLDSKGQNLPGSTLQENKNLTINPILGSKGQNLHGSTLQENKT